MTKQNYETPNDFIRAVEAKFGKITYDLAAEPINSKAKRFFTKEEDSLLQDWKKLNGTLWLNPPFAHIEPWARKCAHSMHTGATIVMLTPASIGSNWFRRFVYPFADVYALNGRITFVGQSNYYNRDCMLSVYSASRPTHGRLLIWQWEDKSEPPIV